MKKAIKDKRIYLVVLIVFLISLYLVFLYRPVSLPLSREGYSEVTVDIQGQEIYLIRDCLALRMVVSADQARSINGALTGSLGYRPGTHDLMNDIFSGYDIEVLMAAVSEVENNTYHANLYLKRKERILKLDSRSSDAIAVALRADAPVYVEDQILNRYGKKVC